MWLNDIDELAKWIKDIIITTAFDEREGGSHQAFDLMMEATRDINVALAKLEQARQEQYGNQSEVTSTSTNS
jgi:hypothetical protein